ncbi:MAG: DUF1501 domain-containing protein [Phycisphaeraceae bacterium]
MRKMLRGLDDVSRRQFVSYAAKTCLGLGVMSPLAAQAAARSAGAARKPAKNVIYMFMNGGLSHLDTFDPKNNSEVSGPVSAISTNVSGIQLSENLPELAKQMDKIALIRSLTSNQGAHERGQYFVRTSHTPRGSVQHPALGAWTVKHGGRINPTLPSNVLIGGGGAHPGAGFLGSEFTPVRIGNPSAGLQNAHLPGSVNPDQFQRRLQLMERFDRPFTRKYEHRDVKTYTEFYDEAVRLMRSEDLVAFDISKESAEMREAYGNNRFGQATLLARRLVQNGVRYVEIEHGGWDTHANNFDAMPDRTAPVDQALATLLQDLDASGLLEETLIVLTTEFGRTPNINRDAGRDHHPRVFSSLLAGGGINGGQVYGKSDEKAYAAAENPVTVPDFNATIAYALGLQYDERVFAPSGRPFTMADDGKPVTDLFT